MLMPGRYVSDTSQQCVTLTQTKWVTTWVDSCWDKASWVWPGYQVIGTGVATQVATGIRISSTGNKNGVSFTLSAVPLVEQELSVQVYSKTKGGIVEAVEEVNGIWVSLGSVAMEIGRNVLRFTPTQNEYQVRFTNTGILVMERMCTKVPRLSQQSMLVDVCDDDGDRYRFGFNGKEKINEWSGIGNYLDYGERGYDVRIARLGYSVDPLTKQYPSLTPYQYSSNNPIQNIDLDGLEGQDANDAKKAAVTGVTVVNQQTAKQVGNLVVKAGGQIVEKTPFWKRALPYVGKVLGTITLVFTPVENAKPNYEFRAEMKKLSDKNDKIYETYQAYRQKTGQKIEPESQVGAERKVTLYRGVNAKHPSITQAYLGIAVPIGGDATPFDHNSGATESEYTSWSIDKSVANYYGSKKGEGGVVLTKQFKVSELTPSADQYSEGEVLVKGVVAGAKVEPAKGGSSSSQFSTK